MPDPTLFLAGILCGVCGVGLAILIMSIDE